MVPSCVRKALVAPILGLSHRDLTRGATVGTVVYGARGGEKEEKKDCLILTNEAVRLLKTKDRQNERSRTKPILAGGKSGGAEEVMLNSGLGKKRSHLPRRSKRAGGRISGGGVDALQAIQSVGSAVAGATVFWRCFAHWPWARSWGGPR